MTGAASGLQRTPVADLLADDLRRRILDGDPPAGAPLREVELAERYRVSRHTLRAALRVLQADGLVRIEANRGARVAKLERDDLVSLFELRTALELEAARLALEHGGGRLPQSVHDAVERLADACAARRSWRVVARRHAAVHESLVNASGSPRIVAAYGSLAAELQLFVVQIRPAWPPDRMAEHHRRLLRDLEREGAEPLRAHLRDGLESVLDPGHG